jgi:hypothetical protein
MDSPRIDERYPHLLTMLLRARGDFWEAPGGEDLNFTTTDMAAWTAVYRGITTSSEARVALDELILIDDRVHADEGLFQRLAGMAAAGGLTYVQLVQELVIPLLRENLLVDPEIRAEHERRLAATTA